MSPVVESLRKYAAGMVYEATDEPQHRNTKSDNPPAVQIRPEAEHDRHQQQQSRTVQRMPQRRQGEECPELRPDRVSGGRRGDDACREQPPPVRLRSETKEDQQ